MFFLSTPTCAHCGGRIGSPSEENSNEATHRAGHSLAFAVEQVRAALRRAPVPDE